MSNDLEFGIIILFLIIIGGFGLYNIQHIHIPISEWKCVEAEIINDDPSYTKCIVYKRIKSNQ